MLHLSKRLIAKLAKDKNYRKVRDHCNRTVKYRSAAHSICNLRFKIPNENPVILSQLFHFIIKDAL